MGVIHRDVKPDNLFVLERDGQDFVKVLDFQAWPSWHTPLGGDRPLTTTVEDHRRDAGVHGAEQATGGSADPRTDLYAVGVVPLRAAGRASAVPGTRLRATGGPGAHRSTAALPSHTPAGDRIPPRFGRGPARAGQDPAHRVRLARRALRALEDAEQRTVPPSRARLGGRGFGTVGSASLAAVATLQPGRVTPLGGHPGADGRGHPGATAGSRRRRSLHRGVPPLVPVSVASTPAGARVVDINTGRVLGRTPYVDSVARSSVPWRLRLEHPGHEAAEVDVVPDSARSVQIPLDRTKRRPVAPTAPPPTAATNAQRKSKNPDPFKALRSGLSARVDATSRPPVGLRNRNTSRSERVKSAARTRKPLLKARISAWASRRLAMSA